MRLMAMLGMALALSMPALTHAKGKKGSKSKHGAQKTHKKAEHAIYAGEMPEPNAHTLRKGQGQIDLFTRSHWGLTNDLQLDVTMGRFLVIGPNAGLEYAFLQNKKQAVSMSVYGQTNWRRYSQRATVMPMYTWGGHRSNRLSTGLGLEVTKFDWSRVPQDRLNRIGLSRTDVVRRFGVPLHIGYDLVRSNKSIFQFWGSTNVAAPALDDPFKFRLGANWTHGWRTFRMSLGVTANYNALADVQEVFDTLSGTFQTFDRDLPRFVPLPYARFWWRF